MIKSLEIQGFKAIKKIFIDNLRHINYFVGPNSSGKSSILQCFQYIRACEWQENGSLILNCKTYKDAMQTLTYFNKDFKFKIEESLVLDVGTYRESDAVLEINGPPVIKNECLCFSSNQYNPHSVSNPNSEDKTKFKDFFKHNYNTKYIDTHNTNFRIEIIRAPQEYWSLSQLNRTADLLETIIEDINYVTQVIFKINLKLGRNKCKEIIDLDTKKNVYIGELSSGIRTFAILRYLLKSSLNSNSAIIMIEEPETSLNPGLQKEIPRIFEEMISEIFGKDASRIQLFVTTHSPFILSGTKNIKSKSFVLEYNEKGTLKKMPFSQKVYLLNNGSIADVQKEYSGNIGPKIQTQASELLGYAFEDLIGKFSSQENKSLKKLKFVFVEGMEAKYFEYVFEGFNFIQCGGFDNILNSYYSLKDLLPKFLGKERVEIYAILDRSNSKGTYVGNNEIIKTDCKLGAFSHDEVKKFNTYHYREKIYMLNRREIENYLYDQSVISSVYSEKSESFNRWFIEKNLNIVKSNIKDEIKLSMFGFDKDKLAKSVAFRKLLTSELKKFIES